MSWKLLSASLIAASVTLTALVEPVSAASNPPPAPAVASLNGHAIPLASGWGPARACLIWRQHGIAECFGTNLELVRRETQLRRYSATSGPTCSSSLDLYSGSSYSGRHLALWDEGYWQELSYYGFNKATRSFLGGACAFHLAQGNFGQGPWYPGYTGPWAYAADMGSWDNTVSSVYID